MPKSFSLVTDFAKFGAENRISLRDPQTIEKFITDARKTIGDAPYSSRLSVDVPL